MVSDGINCAPAEIVRTDPLLAEGNRTWPRPSRTGQEAGPKVSGQAPFLDAQVSMPRIAREPGVTFADNRQMQPWYGGVDIIPPVFAISEIHSPQNEKGEIMPRWPDDQYPALTAQQLRAVWDEESAIITGAPGSGMTHALCARSLRLINEGVQPEDVLYLTRSPGSLNAIRQTFERWVEEGESRARDTNREDIRHFAQLLAQNARLALKTQMQTVQQFCVQYLRDEGARSLDIDPRFTLLTRGQQLQMVSRLTAQEPDMKGVSSDELLGYLHWHRLNAACSNFIQQGYHDEEVLRDWLLGEIGHAGHERWAMPQPPPDDMWNKFAALYDEQKRRQRVLDLDEVVRTATRARRRMIAEGYYLVEDGRHLLVDEVEDMTPAELEIIVNEMVFFQTVTVAYSPSLRTGTPLGTDPGSFTAFLQEYIGNNRRYAGPARHVLGINFRSSNNVSNFLTRMVENSSLTGIETRHAALSSVDGDAPELRVYREQNQLIEGLRESLQLFRESGDDLQHLACLFRWPEVLERFRASLDGAGIPFSVLGRPRRAVEHPARGVIGLWTLLCNPYDMAALLDAAAVWTPKGWQEFNTQTAVSLEEAGRHQGVSLVEAAGRYMKTLSSRSATRKAMSRVVNGLTILQQMLDTNSEIPALRELCVEASLALNKDQYSTPVKGDPIYRLLEYGAAFPARHGESVNDHLRRLLDNIAVHGIPDRVQPGVSLSTIQDAKGQQWDRVWVVEAGERLIPDQYDAQSLPMTFWEEQRQLYAAATRARNQLIFFNRSGSDLELLWNQLVC